jgi:hypothetical protein
MLRFSVHPSAASRLCSDEQSTNREDRVDALLLCRAYFPSPAILLPDHVDHLLLPARGAAARRRDAQNCEEMVAARSRRWMGRWLLRTLAADRWAGGVGRQRAQLPRDCPAPERCASRASASVSRYWSRPCLYWQSYVTAVQPARQPPRPAIRGLDLIEEFASRHVSPRHPFPAS